MQNERVNALDSIHGGSCCCHVPLYRRRARESDGVYWTVQAELKFYGCVFFLLLFGWINQYKKWLTIWLLATISFTLFA